MARTKTIAGVTYTNVHSGQRHAYGDNFYDYDVTSDRPADEVEKICREKVHTAIPKKQWQEEHNAGRSADLYFRNHYTFTARGPGRWLYSVCFPYAD